MVYHDEGGKETPNNTMHDAQWRRKLPHLEGKNEAISWENTQQSSWNSQV